MNLFQLSHEEDRLQTMARSVLRWLRHRVFLFAAFVGLLGLTGSSIQSGGERWLRIGLAGPWRTLHPGLQHTIWAGLLLSHQFDALLGFDDRGLLVGLGARAWERNGDATEYTFWIDQTKTFPDGSSLSATDYKESWESVLRESQYETKSRPLWDILKNVVGSDEFTRTGTLQGLAVPSDDRLVVRFRVPVRLAPEFLAGNRFAAFRIDAHGRKMGTGKYEIRELNSDQVLLVPRLESGETEGLRSTIHVTGLNPHDVEGALLKNEIDVLAYASGHIIGEKLMRDPDLEVKVGPEAVHYGAFLNSEKGKFFEDRSLRQAALQLFTQMIRKEPSRLGPPEVIRADPQVYLPFQTGRLPASEVNQFIGPGVSESGELGLGQSIVRKATQPSVQVRNLLRRSQDRPITMIVTHERADLLNWVRDQGIQLSKSSRSIPHGEYYRFVYGSEPYDILMGGFSVASSDSDGVYHGLGEGGTNVIQGSYRSKLGRLLAKGRALQGTEKLRNHFQEVSRVFFQEVPMVHFGFARSVAIYRKSRVEVSEFQSRRNRGQFHVYQLR